MHMQCNSGIGVGYPQNINMAATWNRTVVFHAGRGTGMMLRAASGGNGTARLSCWSPMMNIMRHPLWGRNHEGYGEDPYLSGEMAFQNVLGMQGHGLDGYPTYSLVATGCKHFAAFDGPGNLDHTAISDADWCGPLCDAVLHYLCYVHLCRWRTTFQTLRDVKLCHQPVDCCCGCTQVLELLAQLRALR